MSKSNRMSLGLATQDSVDPSISTTEGGRRMTTERARNMGYTIVDAGGNAVAKTAAPAAPKDARMSARIAYAKAIEDLPEARNRPSAASGIWANHTIESMPVDRAASFLRGLPEESAPEPKAAKVEAPDAALMQRFRRKLELRIMGLNMRADRGGEPQARDTARKMQEAISIRDRTGCSFGEAFTNVGLPARETISSILN